MRLNVPPIIPYAVGAMLVFFGLLRVKYLGARRSRHAGEDAAQDDAISATPARSKEQRRHLRMGVLWVLLGLFLLISTYIQMRRSQESMSRGHLIRTEITTPTVHVAVPATVPASAPPTVPVARPATMHAGPPATAPMAH